MRWILLAVLMGTPCARAVDVRCNPPSPSINDIIEIELLGCTQPGVLHWGVNPEGPRWTSPLPVYRPVGSENWAVAVRTPLEGPDENGVCRVRLGPFNDTNQLVRSLSFALQWKDGTWSNKDEKNFTLPISSGRISVEPRQPDLNDRILVRVHRSPGPNGLLRWGVNAENDLWKPPHQTYWPRGTFATDDGLAVDTPLGRPDADGVSTVVLGPFNHPEQVVRTLHMAVHWGADWDTDAARNYNVEIRLKAAPGLPAVTFLSPSNNEVIVEAPQMVLQAQHAEAVDMWLNRSPIATVRQTPFELRVPFEQLSFGRHVLTARAFRGDQAGFEQIAFWKVPPYRIETLPPGASWGPTVHDDGSVTLTLHAPGKHFVSVVGDFNRWDRFAHVMNCSPDGTWWLNLPLGPGVHRYQFCIEGRQLLADPYARDVEWKNDRGRESYQPKEAKSIVRVQQPEFVWTATNFVRPALDNLVVYEFHINDLQPGGGFTGVIARLDYIQALGCNAIEPMPFHEFPNDHSWGYNPAFHFAPESSYGTPDELKRLIDEAHRRGLAVIMDIVLNHLDRSSPLYQLYGRDFEESPYFWPVTGDNWGFPDLEQTSRAFRRYAADVLRYWIGEYRIDGIRYDATRWTEWQGYNDWGASWFAYAARQADSNIINIAEHLPSDPVFINTTEMDTTWHDYFRWAIRDMVERAHLDAGKFADVMRPESSGFTNACERMAYTESHDEERVLHELLRFYPEPEALRRARMVLALTLTAPGSVMLYAGQEFGESTRKVVGANPLTWGKLKKKPFLLLQEETRNLTRLRTTHPALRRDDNVVLQTEGVPAEVAVYSRDAPEGAVVFAGNVGKRRESVTLQLPRPGIWVNVFSGRETALRHDPTLKVTLAPGEALVFVQREPDVAAVAAAP